MNDITSLLLTFTITMLLLLEAQWASIETMRILASIAGCQLLIKFYDWLRLFDGTAFYITLIEITLSDVAAFLILFIMALLIFGVPLTLLDANRGEDQKLIGEVFGFWLLDAIYNQYLLSLGEFGGLLEQAELGSQERVVIFFFWVTTFFTMITMLNMLIAIMGDSFAEATENKEKYAIKTKFDLLSSQAAALSQTTSEDEKNVYMIVVSVMKDEDEEEDAWQGSINKVAFLTNKSIRAMGSELKKYMDKQHNAIVADVATQVRANQQRIEAVEANLKGNTLKIDEALSSLSQVKDLVTKLVEAKDAE